MLLQVMEDFFTYRTNTLLLWVNLKFKSTIQVLVLAEESFTF